MRATASQQALAAAGPHRLRRGVYSTAVASRVASMVFGPQLKRKTLAVRIRTQSTGRFRPRQRIRKYELSRCRVSLRDCDFRIRVRGLNKDNVESRLALVKPKTGPAALPFGNVHRPERHETIKALQACGATANKR